MRRYYVGIDIGSTAAKSVALDEGLSLVYHEAVPTGWDSAGTALQIRERLSSQGLEPAACRYVATGYGRVSVPYARETVTEITCHAKGAAYLFGQQDGMVVDIGGQDTKIIALAGGKARDFVMNDKCSAGTGRFLEVMAATLGVDLAALLDLAQSGGNVSITSLCTVFAESEVIGLIGSGAARQDIAYAVVDSIVTKVATLCSRLHQPGQRVFLTGGLCEARYILDSLGRKLGAEVVSHPLARYAGAIGAALAAAALGDK